MGIEQEVFPTHWNYFLCIEDDIAELARWVELTEGNYDCYSIELARLLMTASAEVDVIAKLICGNHCNTPNAKTIKAYQGVFCENFLEFATSEVTIPRYGITLHPFLNWTEPNTSPLWWTANNKVKHQRTDHFHQATLKNVLNAVAALFYFLVIYYGLTLQKIPSNPKLFHSSLVAAFGTGNVVLINKIKLW